MVERKFYKVGNGLFAMESTNGIVSVYDCGGQTQPIIEQAITRASGGRHGHIDNLFISHYHHDHINGLMLLLALFDVDRVILPMVPNLTRVLNFSTARSNYHYADFILNPQEFIKLVSGNTKVIQVGTDEEANINYQEGTLNLEAITENTTFNGEVVRLGIGDWLYVVYNRKVLTLAELTVFMNRLGLDVSASTEVIIKVLQNTNSRNLKEALSLVFSKAEMNRINDYSMLVWSGRADTLKNGCMFTGDYNAQTYLNDFKAVYGALLPHSEIVQIPHHGSKNNFHPDICSPIATHVISASPGPYRTRKTVDPQSVINDLSKLRLKEEDTRTGDVII